MYFHNMLLVLWGEGILWKCKWRQLGVAVFLLSAFSGGFWGNKALGVTCSLEGPSGSSSNQIAPFSGLPPSLSKDSVKQHILKQSLNCQWPRALQLIKTKLHSWWFGGIRAYSKSCYLSFCNCSSIPSTFYLGMNTPASNLTFFSSKANRLYSILVLYSIFSSFTS